MIKAAAIMTIAVLNLGSGELDVEHTNFDTYDQCLINLEIATGALEYLGYDHTFNVEYPEAKVLQFINKDLGYQVVGKCQYIAKQG